MPYAINARIITMKKTNAPEHDQRAPCIIGHIKTPAGMMIGEPLEVCVRRCDNDDELCRAPVDGSGRFRISSIIDDSLPGRAIELNVFRVSYRRTARKADYCPSSTGKAGEQTVNVSLPSMATVQTGDRQPIPMPRSQRKAVAEQWRMAMVQKLRGRVPERDSRPIVPKGINRAIILD